MFCTNCGHKIEEGNRFCTNCGKAVGSGAVTPVIAEEAVVVEAPKKAGLDVATLVWSIMCVELCVSLFSIPSIVLTVLAAFKTEEEAAANLRIAKALNIVGMCCFAGYFLFMLAICFISFFA